MSVPANIYHHPHHHHISHLDAAVDAFNLRAVVEHLLHTTTNDTTCAIQSDAAVMLDMLLLDVICLPWLGAFIGSLLVGLSGILPLLVISIDHTDNLKQGASANRLKVLLSFAVGGLLGDVFLHSLPEMWTRRNGHHSAMVSGMLVLSGLMTFVITEKLFAVITQLADAASHEIIINDDDDDKPEEQMNNNVKSMRPLDADANRKHITGYLNLIANMIDNFTHGLSLGGAFLVSVRLGCLTTFAILVHEIPHEVGDFAILLRSGFNRWDAAKFQLLTAGGGLIGSLVAIAFSGASNAVEARTSWIMPFTAGTFLHIGLVTVLPDLLKEEDPKESFKQLLALLLGIFMMAVMSSLIE